MHGIRLEINPSKIAFGPSYRLKNLDKTRVAMDHCYRLDSIIRHRFRKSSFLPIHTLQHEDSVSKTSALESVLEKLRVRWPKPPFTCGRKSKTQKNLRFQKYPLTDGPYPYLNICFVFRSPCLLHAWPLTFLLRIEFPKSLVECLFKCRCCFASCVGQTTRHLHTMHWVSGHLGISPATADRSHC